MMGDITRWLYPLHQKKKKNQFSHGYTGKSALFLFFLVYEHKRTDSKYGNAVTQQFVNY